MTGYQFYEVTSSDYKEGTWLCLIGSVLTSSIRQAGEKVADERKSVINKSKIDGQQCHLFILSIVITFEERLSLLVTMRKMSTYTLFLLTW